MVEGPIILALGGRAVADAAAWERAASRLMALGADGRRVVVVVVDALPGVWPRMERLVGEALRDAHEAGLQELATRHLQLARELEVDADAAAGAELAALSRLLLSITLAGEASPRVRARVRSLGPLLLLKLVGPWLARRVEGVTVVDPGDLLRVGPGADASRYLHGRPEARPDPELAARLAEHRVVVTAAGVGADFAGDPVLLGRPGPERSAAWLAARLGATEVEAWLDGGAVWTDEDGATPVSALSPVEARALATVRRDLCPVAVAGLAAAGVTLTLRADDHPGTRVGGAVPADRPTVRARRGGLLVVTVDGTLPAGLAEALREHPVRLHAVAAAADRTVLVLEPEGAPLDADELADLRRDLAAWNPTPPQPATVRLTLGEDAGGGGPVVARLSPAPGVGVEIVAEGPEA